MARERQKLTLAAADDRNAMIFRFPAKTRMTPPKGADYLKNLSN
jgi:hypothetical protein